MKQKRVIIDRNSRVRRQSDPIPWKYCILTVVCGLALVSGFFLAARQHFSAIQTGMDNADLRFRITKLKDENRKLLLSRERASTPSKIAKLATAYGFTEAPQIVLNSAPAYQNASNDPSQGPPIAITGENPVIEPSNEEAPKQKTAVKTALPKSVTKGDIADDQIAALRRKDD